MICQIRFGHNVRVAKVRQMVKKKLARNSDGEIRIKQSLNPTAANVGVQDVELVNHVK